MDYITFIKTVHNVFVLFRLFFRVLSPNLFHTDSLDSLGKLFSNKRKRLDITIIRKYVVSFYIRSEFSFVRFVQPRKNLS